MKKLFLLHLVFFAALSLQAQETLPIYQQYLMDGKFLINPAHYGETEDMAFNGNYQKQFSKFDQSPNVQSLGLHANVFDRVGAGLSFFRDENGPISANGITAGASYFIPLDDDGERLNQFSFGTAVNFYNMHIDLAALNPATVGDPLLQEGTNDIFIAYANLGAQAVYRRFFGGISVVDIPLSNDVPIVNGIEPAPIKYILNGGYDWVLAEGFSVEPSVLVNLNTNSSHLVDFNLMAKIFSENNLFSGGISLRTSKDQTGFQQMTLSPVVRGKINRLTFGAAYNFGLKDVQTYAGNSFMLSIGYRLENFINTRGFRYR